MNHPLTISVQDIDPMIKNLAAIRGETKKIIFGQDHTIDLCLITLLSGGHGLLVGLPGLAKTKLVQTLATVMGLDNKRIQFTPDLLPSDILGAEILDEDERGKRLFRFIKGPVFTQLLMGDEINRASPRTQSALLQAMQESHISFAGQHYDLPKPFHVLATQNPIDQEGTYPLPEAQLDRFMMQIIINYPERHSEKEMLLATTAGTEREAKPIIKAQQLIDMQTAIEQMPISESVIEAILNLVDSMRPDPKDKNKNATKYLKWGAGPRASQAFLRGARAKALLEGRFSPSIEDVKTLALPILQHRCALEWSAKAENITLETLITDNANKL